MAEELLGSKGDAAVSKIVQKMIGQFLVPAKIKMG
jgi:hypothetical protein